MPMPLPLPTSTPDVIDERGEMQTERGVWVRYRCTPKLRCLATSELCENCAKGRNPGLGTVPEH